MTSDAEFQTRLAAVLARLSPGHILGLTRLSGGANMESWSIDWGQPGATHGYILRRAPSAEWMAGRPFGLDSEAALVRAARAGGVLAPEVAAVLTPDDDLGEGYVMVRVEAEVSPPVILAEAAPTLIDDIARELARIHALPLDAIPAAIPRMDSGESLAALKQRFIDYGGDRPIIAAAIRWLEEHLPEPARPALVHGDLRLGNIMATRNGLAAVLDWELAHIGDAHEDLAYGCMTVWRFGAIDHPAFGLADLDRYFAAYEAAGGAPVDRARFRFWLIYRTLWWALGCLQMGAFWRSGVDASLERTVIARRTSEQELDLLMLLEEELPLDIRHPELVSGSMGGPWTLEQVQGDEGGELAPTGETTASEILGAIANWLATDVKARAEGRDKFMAAVAINALGIVRRELDHPVAFTDKSLSDDLLAGRATLATSGLLSRLRRMALDKLANDMPKYAALAKAREQWTTE
jgi:aminoglycoside phosphotransferase (APT) family kinase protein